jgi:hypothetical protein
MKTEELKRVLVRLKEVFSAAGMAAPANDLHSVARLLDGSEGKTVEEFISETKALLEKPTGRPRVAGVSPTADERLVADHSSRLLSAGTDRAAFQAALDALDADRSLGPAEWYAVANRFRNEPTAATHVYRFKSMKAAREAIWDTFIERFEAQSKRGVINRIFGRAS